jgi:SAM-dependent methyltransferase
VTLVSAPLQSAGLTPGRLDAVYSVSAIEHFSQEDLNALARTLPTVLAPGGHVILTIDLFLDLHPFTTKSENRFGRNIDVAKLLEVAGLEIVTGNTSELCGFRDFDTDTVMQVLPDLLIGQDWPALTQIIVARTRP